MLPIITSDSFNVVQMLAVAICSALLYKHVQTQDVLHQEEEGFPLSSQYGMEGCLDEGFYTRNVITCCLACKQVNKNMPLQGPVPIGPL